MKQTQGHDGRAALHLSCQDKGVEMVQRNGAKLQAAPSPHHQAQEQNGRSLPRLHNQQLPARHVDVCTQEGEARLSRWLCEGNAIRLDLSFASVSQ